MFNVSAMLLDDALLKCFIAEVVLISVIWRHDTDISQGRVATYLRCGGIFDDSIIEKFFPIVIVK